MKTLKIIFLSLMVIATTMIVASCCGKKSSPTEEERIQGIVYRIGAYHNGSYGKHLFYLEGDKTLYVGTDELLAVTKKGDEINFIKNYEYGTNAFYVKDVRNLLPVQTGPHRPVKGA